MRLNRPGPCIALLPAILLAASPPVPPGQGGTRLSITYPPASLKTPFTRVRVAGSCEPSCRVTIAGRPARVYPTGAFVGLVPLEPGETTIEVAAERAGAKDRLALAVVCEDPLVTSPASPPVAEQRMLVPAADTVLQPGDELRVQCKGSPGMRASWSLGKVVREAAMEEAPPLATDDGNEIRGIYRGAYRVREGDCVSGGRVRFALRDALGRTARVRSSGRVTLLPRARLRRGVVGPDGAPASAEPGGAQEWRLDAGTQINLCGESGGNLRVLLASGMRCWVPERSVTLSKGEGGWPPSAVGAPAVERTPRGATVRIPASGAPPARVSPGKAPGELAVEIFGAAAFPRRAEAAGAGPVETARIPATETDILVAVVQLRNPAGWGYALRRTEEGIALDVKAPPGQRPGGVRVVIDPGHGGAHPGAVSPTGLREKDVNLQVARAAAAFLRRRGVRAVLTRDDDRTLSLSARVERARREEADIFVSVHHDSCPGHCDPLARRGAATYYGAPQSRGLATTLLDRLGTVMAPPRGARQAGFAVVVPADYLAVLVECGYLSHPEEEERILGEGYARRAGRAIAEGVLGFAETAG